MEIEKKGLQTKIGILKETNSEDNTKLQQISSEKSEFITKVKKDFLKKQFDTYFTKLQKNTKKTSNLINNSKDNHNPKKNKKKIISKKKRENDILIIKMLKNIAEMQKLEA